MAASSSSPSRPGPAAAVRFEFASAARIVFGAGASRELAAIAAPWGRRALVITGGDARRFSATIEPLRNEMESVSFASIGSEPDVATIDAAAAACRERRDDFVIAIGGGSVIDSGKAVAALAANEGKALDYLEVVGRGQPLTRPALPVIAVPTTAGTGAEVTRNAVLGVPAAGIKASLRSPHMIPKVAVVDPELTLTLPAHVTAATGMDALTQLIEPFLCNRANPLTDGFCREGLPRAADAMPRLLANPRDIDARTSMSMAALLGGLALANAGLGAVHGLAAPLGGRFAAPHGAICAALLPIVLEANLRALREREPEHPALRRYDELARLLTGRPEAKPQDAVDFCAKLVSDLRIPPLGHWGVAEADASAIAAQAARASSMKANPLPLTASELETIVRRAIRPAA